MKLRNISWLASAALLGALLPAAVQAQAPDAHHGINSRLHNQQSRIHQGIGSGQLTRRETRNLRTRDARIHRQEARDRRFDKGHLTGGERQRLNHELNRTSRAIYRDKHNNRVR